MSYGYEPKHKDAADLGQTFKAQDVFTMTANAKASYDYLPTKWTWTNFTSWFNWLYSMTNAELDKHMSGTLPKHGFTPERINGDMKKAWALDNREGTRAYKDWVLEAYHKYCILLVEKGVITMQKLRNTDVGGV